MKTSAILENFLETLFTDFFQDKHITHYRLLTGSFNHLANLTTNNPGGVFSGIIADTTTKTTALGTALSHRMMGTGERKGAKMVKDMARATFQSFVSRGEGRIRSLFGEESAQYAQFLPQQVTHFFTCTDAEFAKASSGFAARCETYVAEVGTDFRDSAVALADAYATALANLTTGKVKSKGSITEANAAAKALSEQLCKNWLLIAAQFPLQPQKVKLYISTHLFYPAHNTRIYKGKPAAGSTVLVKAIDYTPGRNLHMKNKGAAALKFFMKLNGEVVGEAFIVPVGGRVDKAYSDFFHAGTELWVTNLSSEHIGEYKVDDVV